MLLSVLIVGQFNVCGQIIILPPFFLFLPFPVQRVVGRPGPGHNLWVKFAEQVSSTQPYFLFPSSCSTFNQIEKKLENYNFRLALSQGNISQKRKHKKLEEEFPTRDVGYIHHGNIILESLRAYFKRLCYPQRKAYFPNVHLSLTKIWQTGFFHSVSVDFFEVPAHELKLGFSGRSL